MIQKLENERKSYEPFLQGIARKEQILNDDEVPISMFSRALYYLAKRFI